VSNDTNVLVIEPWPKLVMLNRPSGWSKIIGQGGALWATCPNDTNNIWFDG